MLNSFNVSGLPTFNVVFDKIQSTRKFGRQILCNLPANNWLSYIISVELDQIRICPPLELVEMEMQWPICTCEEAGGRDHSTSLQPHNFIRHQPTVLFAILRDQMGGFHGIYRCAISAADRCNLHHDYVRLYDFTMNLIRHQKNKAWCSQHTAPYSPSGLTRFAWHSWSMDAVKWCVTFMSGLPRSTGQTC